jgi:hypothetical protein
MHCCPTVEFDTANGRERPAADVDANRSVQAREFFIAENELFKGFRRAALVRRESSAPTQ